MPLAEAEFDSSSGLLRWPNGRVLLKTEKAALTGAVEELLEDAQWRNCWDDTALREYSRRVIMNRHRHEGFHAALRAAKKWPRVEPYWPRIRRRICTCCLKQVALTEPRYLVCGGCGEARYCSEACQRAHWAEHQKECPAGRPG